MSKKEPMHPLYVIFLLVMLLVIVAGLLLMIYGSLTNRLQILPRPGHSMVAQAARLLHG